MRLVKIAAVSVTSLMAIVASQASAQQAPAPPPSVDTGQPAQAAEPDAGQEIIVTGFRRSLAAALAEKRLETAAIDSIVAEDIGKFPDSNLAESMQRIPGVALARGDGGEGRNISVRGLGAGFTRVRINGMEGTSQTGSSDIFGAGNFGRSFDFNVFPSEIFQALTVRKTPSADVEEGSLGATVDLRAPRPLDGKDDFTLAVTARGVYNEISEKVDPRASLLVSKQFADGTFGVLGSFAYTKRHLREVGYSAVNILRASDDGGFCSPVGVTPQNPATNATRGTNAANCSAGNPRTSNPAAYQAVTSLRGVANVPGGGAFLPRLPRYLNSETEYERLAGTLTLQWQPSDDTNIWVDGLYSRFDTSRQDSYIAGLSFGRSQNDNGKPMSSIRDIAFNENGSLVHGVFDGVDVRSESLIDDFVSTFSQANLNFEHRFSDSFQLTGMAGVSRSVFDNPSRLTVTLDAIDVDGFTIDFRDDPREPTIGYGFDIANPANFAYGPRTASGDVRGNYSTRNARAKTVNQTYELNGIWNAVEGFKVRFGGQYRESDYKRRAFFPIPSIGPTPALAAGTTLADITTQITGFDKALGGNAPAGWTIIDHEAWKKAVGFDSFEFCGVECGQAISDVRERVTSGYAMVAFDTQDALPIPIRGDFGVRYAHTNQFSRGTTPRAAPAGSRFPTVGIISEVERSYDDWLPSANVVFELQHDLLLRLSSARVMSRADLGVLSGGGSVNATVRTATIANPLINPIRADTFDASLEWYFAPGSLISVAYFKKDISSYIQSISSIAPFSSLNLPVELLANTPTSADDLFTVTQVTNTPGGPLEGFELNVQAPLRFLPGFLGNLGVLANYTRVTSKIDYILQSANGVPVQTTTDDLVGLSKNAASATLYYEDDRFSIRTTGNYRGGYLRAIPSGAPDSDVLGNRATFYMDASASFNITEKAKLILEAQNLTDERNELFVDSRRQDPLFETRIGRTFTAGVNVRF